MCREFHASHIIEDTIIYQVNVSVSTSQLTNLLRNCRMSDAVPRFHESNKHLLEITALDDSVAIRIYID